jgi:type II secretory pathway component PulC
MDKESSDEKLLKIIEGTGKVKGFPRIGIRLKGKKISLLPSKFHFPDLKLLKLTLHDLNKGLFIISGVLTLYFLYSFIRGTVIDKESIPPVSVKNSGVNKLVTQQEGEAIDIQVFQDAFKRNMFFPAGKKQVTPAATKQSEDILAATKELKLVGVIWSDNPEVMIENTKESRTYLLKKSETFGQQQFKVKDILRNSVILEITGGEGVKEWELR